MHLKLATFLKASFKATFHASLILYYIFIYLIDLKTKALNLCL